MGQTFEIDGPSGLNRLFAALFLQHAVFYGKVPFLLSVHQGHAVDVPKHARI